ncbi:MAG: glutathione-dependent formaldehyde dehydrogenase, partial [Desulfuromonadales bacterium]|nr:glutathione-dependent formaldehyde dehydrogenase [Desulfuromonadales bacterium]
AERVIAVDLVPERLRLAETWGGAEPLNIQDLANVAEELKRRTGGRGPDGIIDAVGLAAQNHSAAGVVDRARQKMHLESDHPGVLPLAIKACRKGGTIAVAGHYDGAGRLPIGAAYAKNLQLKFGLSHPQRYLRPLLQRIEQGEIDPAPILTHTFSLSQAPQGYRLFDRKEEGCIKVVLKP